MDKFEMGGDNVPMPNRSSKLPRNVDQLAKAIIDQATSEAAPEPQVADYGKNPAAVALGRLGGLKGGKARAIRLTGERRSEIARAAAHARWHAKKKDSPAT
jgi:hypothetical protein